MEDAFFTMSACERVIPEYVACVVSVPAATSSGLEEAFGVDREHYPDLALGEAPLRYV